MPAGLQFVLILPDGSKSLVPAEWPAADVEKLGAIAKCAPPLRSAKEQERLWQHLIAGELTTVGSDHSPSPPEMKENANFFKVWGGISGAQHALPILLTEAHSKRGGAASAHLGFALRQRRQTV